MAQAPFDPGLTQRYTGQLRRALNRNGEFNVRRFGTTWRDRHPYLSLINASWGRFLLIVAITFVAVNLLFAFLYVSIGLDHLHGARTPSPAISFLNAFFFSTHTLTTVGYGNMWPVGPLANSIAALESLLGVLAFAIATGLLFGRFSRPSARIAFSRSALVAPYQGGHSLQFRIANRRSNNLIDVDARILMMAVEDCGGELQRRFFPLTLERESVLFFPLAWTVVHPIGPDSPLYRLSADDYKRLQLEILVLIRAFDESFGQNVHIRYSYRYDEILWGARYGSTFDVAGDGSLHLDVSRISDTVEAALPPQQSPNEAASEELASDRALTL